MKLTITNLDEDLTAVINKEGLYLLGRHEDNEIYVKDEKGERQLVATDYNVISRKHLGIAVTNIVLLTDLNSTNGSYLDRRKFEQRIITKPGEYNLLLGFVSLKLKYEK